MSYQEFRPPVRAAAKDPGPDAGDVTAWVREMRRLAALPLTRCEARMAAPRLAMWEALVVAAVLDAAALGAFALELCAVPGSGQFVWFVRIAVGAALAPVVLSLVWAVALGAAGLAGEREADTLDSLLLTPMDRRELLWAKLLGRTAPPRRLMVAGIPAYLAGAAALLVLPLLEPGRGGGWGAGAVSLATATAILALAAVALSWLVLFFQLHAAAAAALCLSARFRRTLTTGIATYAAILIPAALFLFSAGFGSLIWAMTLGPAMFKELVRDFDEVALGRDA